MAKAWSPEQRAAQADRMRARWTPEFRAAHTARMAKQGASQWNGLSPKERAAKVAQLREGKRRAREARAEAAARIATCAEATLAGEAVPVSPARAVKGSRDARTTPRKATLADAVRDVSAISIGSSEDGPPHPPRQRLLVVPGGDGARAPERPVWTERNGAPEAAARTNGDLGRHLAALVDGLAARLAAPIADQVAARLGGRSSAPVAAVDPLRPRLVELARLAVEMAHTEAKSSKWFTSYSRVLKAAADLETALALEVGR